MLCYTARGLCRTPLRLRPRTSVPVASLEDSSTGNNSSFRLRRGSSAVLLALCGVRGRIQQASELALVRNLHLDDPALPERRRVDLGKRLGPLRSVGKEHSVTAIAHPGMQIPPEILANVILPSLGFPPRPG
jgi:hypothetical protein